MKLVRLVCNMHRAKARATRLVCLISLVSLTSVGGSSRSALSRMTTVNLPGTVTRSLDALLGSTAPAYSQEVEQWGTEEVTLHSDQRYANPFKDVVLTGRFTCGDRSLEVSGFFDGDATWKLRFMPAMQGSCGFVTTSNDPALNRATGSFSVSAPSKGNHGNIHIEKTWHFSYADGTSYFLLGTTLYNWLNRDEELQEQTLATLKHNPFTKVRFGLFPKWYAFNHEEPKVYPFVKTDANTFDLDRFDPRFFHAIEARILQLQSMGIEADIILFHPYDHLGFATMDATHDDAYIRYVAARLSAFRNVWWTMANEYDLFDPKVTPGQRTKDWDRMFRTLEASDPYQHPRGIHNLADWYDHNKPWITHAIIQDGTGHPGRRLAAARAKYQKPVVVDEYGYEGNNGRRWGNLTAAEEVNRHWEITMQGGYASHGETYVHPGGVLWWAAGGTLVGDSPSRLGFLKQVMTEGPFQDMVPAPEIVRGGTVLALKGRYYLLRVTSVASNQHVEIELEGNGPYAVEMIDPWLMKTYKLGYTPGGLQAFDPPMAPSLLRFQRVANDESKQTAIPVQALFAGFLEDPSIADPPKAVPIQQAPRFYSVQYTVGELLDDPRTSALVKKYAPGILTIRFVRASTLEQLMGSAGPDQAGDLLELSRELSKVPVEH